MTAGGITVSQIWLARRNPTAMNNITRIPPRIGSLRNLEDLYLCKWTLPNKKCCPLMILTVFFPYYKARNDLFGGVPESISKLGKLDSMHIQDNPRLTGDLDPLCNNVKSSFYGAADCRKADLTCSCCKACS